MQAFSEPPVSEPPLSPATIGAYLPPAHRDQRRVFVRLRDGETILVGSVPSYEEALVLAQRTILKLGLPEGEWPMFGDRFINPDTIVSVDVLKWG